MKMNFRHSTKVLATAASLAALVACQPQKGNISLEHQGDTLTIVHIKNPSKYLILPIQESRPEGKVKLDTGSAADVAMDVRLAIDSVDYYVPFALPEGVKEATVTIGRVAADAMCWDSLRLADTFDTTNREYYRPVYHHTPLYGWMNDANGLVYKDGEYHLYFQYNPYGSKWGNMHWGHSVSKDLIHWEHLAPAIARDTLGHIFSGSSVVDHNNSAGYGKDALIAFYTSASDEHGQIQCMAYSTDNGRTYTKYEGNPILTPFDGLKDFRDPKVFWYEGTKRWIMVLAVGQEMQFFSSPNLKDWTFESSFGKGHGAHGNVWECPDLFELPVEGTNEKKWVLLCSLGDGPFGDSATQYFVGSFNGKEFVNESPSKTKWMDWGKDHYATVTWSDAPDNRRIAIAWMSNWQYANDVPTSQYRSPNSVPRDLSLFIVDGETYLQSAPSPELLALRDASKKRSFKVNGTRTIKDMISGNDGAYEIELTIENQRADVIGFRLYNDKGEEVDMQYDMKEKKFSMDRRKSGEVSFNENFPMLTWTAIESGKDALKLRLFVDKSSVEAFGDGGRFAMTNQVFPSEPYNHIDFYSKGGAYKVDSFVVYKLKP